MATLTKREKKFVEIKAETGNGTLAVKEAYGIEDPNYAGVKAHRLIRKDKIVKAIADALPDDLLAKRHLELLNKREVYKLGYGEDVEYEMSDQPDTQAVSKGLDMAYKIKGTYAPEKSLNLNIEVPVGKQKTATDAIIRYLNGHSNNPTI